MRQKVTKASKIGMYQVELPVLTDKQEKFCAGILAGKTASDAYRAAYDTPGMSRGALWTEASKLHGNPKVALWLSVARKARLGTAVLTLEGHMTELERLREIAIESGNVGAAVQAETYRGKAAGHYTEHVIHTIRDPADTLRAIREISPELAHAMATKLAAPAPERVVIDHDAG